jgi:catechol 2,3-dioxygenase-like lactoylglutathione lyase family enzyme
MGFHHVALASRDTAATHAFYTEVMGFELVKVVAAPTPSGRGWAKHFFYDTGSDGMIAFWELHDAKISDDYRADHARSLGLPVWVNHLAFDAPTMDDLERHREHWRAHGITVAEVDHGFCVSIYATDPNGIMVEFCHTTRPFSEDERRTAQARLLDPNPELDPDYPVTMYDPIPAPV